MTLYCGLNPILVGPRKYGEFDENSPYDFIIIAPEKKVIDILIAWKDAEIVEYDNPRRYIISGYIPKGDPRDLVGQEEGANHNIILMPKKDSVSDRHYILSNWNIRRIIQGYGMVLKNKDELKTRLKMVVDWARFHNVYGGAYPDIQGYMIYTINTIEKGYKADNTLSSIYIKCMYHSPSCEYRHVAHVSNRSFAHMRDLLQNRAKIYPYNYRIISANDLLKAMHASKIILDDLGDIEAYASNDGIIHSSTDITSHIQSWINAIGKYAINASFAPIPT